MATKKVFRVLAIGLILGAMFAVSSQAATITFSKAAGNPNPTYGSGAYGGGEFNALITGGTIFPTFCLEMNETISFGHAYDFTIDGINAINGGIAGGNPDPISSQTAYLFSRFSQGTLPGYSHTADEQVALQYAIWRLENEVVDLSALNGTAAKALAEGWITLANANAGEGFWGVQVINPYSGEVQHQSVLQLVPVPEAGALILFGSGLIGLIGYRRTRRME